MARNKRLTQADLEAMDNGELERVAGEASERFNKLYENDETANTPECDYYELLADAAQTLLDERQEARR